MMDAILHAEFEDGTGMILLADCTGCPHGDGATVTIVFRDGSERRAVITDLGAGLTGSGGDTRLGAVYDPNEDRFRIVDRT